MPEVYNKRNPQEIPQGAIYVGRPTKWGNPFSHIRDKNTTAAYIVETIEEAVMMYSRWIQTKPHLLEALPELRGKNLVCWCSSPSKRGPCHAHILIKLANS